MRYLSQVHFYRPAEPLSRSQSRAAASSPGLRPDADKLKVVNEIVSVDAQDEYVTTKQELLEERAITFYDRLITSIDPSARTRRGSSGLVTRTGPCSSPKWLHGTDQQLVLGDAFRNGR